MVMGGEWAQKNARYAPGVLTLPLLSVHPPCAAHFREPWCPTFLGQYGLVVKQPKHVLW